MSGFVKAVIRPVDVAGSASAVHIAPCRDCGKDTEPRTSVGRPLFRQWDMYIVRDEVWAEAGMVGWDSGFLCTPCLRKRLARDLTEDDYWSVPTGEASGSAYPMWLDPEYAGKLLHEMGALEEPSGSKQTAADA